MTDLPELPEGAFNKWDTKPDEVFYSPTHVLAGSACT